MAGNPLLTYTFPNGAALLAPRLLSRTPAGPAKSFAGVFGCSGSIRSTAATSCDGHFGLLRRSRRVGGPLAVGVEDRVGVRAERVDQVLEQAGRHDGDPRLVAQQDRLRRAAVHHGLEVTRGVGVEVLDEHRVPS